MAKRRKWPWVARHANETLAEKVERLKLITGHEDDNSDSDDLFTEIESAGDPAAIPLLLLMRTREDDPNLSDERDMIVRAMTSWEPQEQFIDAFAKVAGTMARTAPVKLTRELWHDLMAGPEEVVRLRVERLDGVPVDDRAPLIAFLESVDQRRALHFVRAGFRMALNRLRHPGGSGTAGWAEVLAEELARDLPTLCREAAEEPRQAEGTLAELERVLADDRATAVLVDRLASIPADERAAVATFLEANQSPTADDRVRGNRGKVVAATKWTSGADPV